MIFLDGIAYDTRIQVAQSSANALEWTLGDGERWQVLAMRFTYTTSAVAGDRTMVLLAQYGPAGSDFVPAVADVVQPASQTYTYFVLPGIVASTAVVDSRVLMRWPFPLEIQGGPTNVGWVINSDVAGADAGDTFGDLHVYGRRAYGYAP